jgi:uncharacterized membrane protein YcaP (DUF421 family)
MDVREVALVAFRGLVIYVFLLVLLRVMGKRTVGGPTVFDFMVALILGELVDEPIYGDAPLAQALVALTAIAGLHYLNSYLGYRSTAFDRLTGGSPRVVVRNGHLDHDALAGEHVNPNELMGMLRAHEIEDLKQVKLAILEPDGKLSVLKASDPSADPGGRRPRAP